MRVTLAYVFIASYLLFGSGIVFNIHYCKGEMKELKAYKAVSVCCEHDTDNESEVLFTHCCDLQQIQLSLTSHDSPGERNIVQPLIETSQILAEDGAQLSANCSATNRIRLRAGPNIPSRIFAKHCARIHYG